MAEPEPLQESLPGDNVLLQMFRTTQAVRDLLIRTLEGTGVSADEYAVLSVVAVLGAVSPTEIARRLRVPPTSISRHVARLLAAGLVVRAPNPSDRRSYLLELTDDGHATGRIIAPRFYRIVQQLRERVDVDDVQVALTDLELASRELLLDVDTAIR